MSTLSVLNNWYSENRYLFLFTSLVLLILIPPFLLELAIVSLLIYILLTLVLINCLLITFKNWRKGKIGFLLGLFSLSYIWYIMLANEGQVVLKLLSNIILITLFVLTFAKLVKEIFNLEKITGQVVLGAIGAYLLLGLVGAFLFDLVEIIYPNSFSNMNVFNGFYAEIYLSFITISTLGYGDITPITPQGQAVAIFVSITGQLYLTILMAMLVGKFLKDSEW